MMSDLSNMSNRNDDFAASKTITHEQYLQLVGLFALARKENEMLERIERAARLITGEAGDGGFTGDFLYGDKDPDELLMRLDIVVDPAPVGFPLGHER